MLTNSFFILRPPPIEYAPQHAIQWRWFFGEALVSAYRAYITKCGKSAVRIFPLQVWSNMTHHVSKSGELVVVNVQRQQRGIYTLQALLTTPRRQLSSTSAEYFVDVAGRSHTGALLTLIGRHMSRIRKQRSRLALLRRQLPITAHRPHRRQTRSNVCQSHALPATLPAALCASYCWPSARLLNNTAHRIPTHPSRQWCKLCARVRRHLSPHAYRH